MNVGMLGVCGCEGGGFMGLDGGGGANPVSNLRKGYVACLGR